MSAAPKPTTPCDQPTETPKARARRVISARSTVRKEQLMETLVESVVVPEDAEGLTQQADSIYYAFKPRNAWQDWLTSEIATIMVRICRCSRIERRMRESAAYRAIDFWEDDQKVEVETLALKIHRQPGKTVAKLRLTPAGCDWLRVALAIPGEDRPERVDRRAAGAGGGPGRRRPEHRPDGPGFAAAQVAELEAQRLSGRGGRRGRPGAGRGGPDRQHPRPVAAPPLSRSLHRQMK